MISPIGFKRQGVDSLFLSNSLQYIYIIIGIVLIYLLIKAIYYAIVNLFDLKDEKVSNCHAALLRIIRPFEFGLLMALLECSYLNLATFSFL